MNTISLGELQQDPAGWLPRVQAGETLTVVVQDQAVAEIRPLAAPRGARPFGLAQGEFVVPDDFDAPLPESVVRNFECP